MSVAMNAPDLLTATADTFATDCGSFLESLVAVFPECPHLATLLSTFNATCNSSISPIRSAARTKLIEEFDAQLRDHYLRIRDRDASALGDFSNGFLADIALVDKWNDAGIDDATRDAIWQWLDTLAQSSQLYSFYKKVPTGMLSKLSGVAMDLSKEGNPAIDPKLFETVFESLDPSEVQTFAQEMMAQPSNLEAVLGLVSRTAGAPEMSGLLGMIQSAQGLQGLPGIMGSVTQ